jgi:hypothetical protein
MDRLPETLRDDRCLDDAEDAVPPTPETLAKLRGDPLLRLLKRGQIDTEGFEAAVAIRRAVESLAQPLRHRAMRAISNAEGTSFDPTRGSRVAAPASHRTIDAQRRYNDWVDAMRGEHMPVGPVLDVIVDGYSCRAVDVRRRRRKGRTVKEVLAGLELYVDLARHPRRRPRAAELRTGQKM